MNRRGKYLFYMSLAEHYLLANLPTYNPIFRDIEVAKREKCGPRKGKGDLIRFVHPDTARRYVWITPKEARQMIMILDDLLGGNGGPCQITDRVNVLPKIQATLRAIAKKED